MKDVIFIKLQQRSRTSTTLKNGVVTCKRLIHRQPLVWPRSQSAPPLSSRQRISRRVRYTRSVQLVYSWCTTHCMQCAGRSGSSYCAHLDKQAPTGNERFIKTATSSRRHAKRIQDRWRHKIARLRWLIISLWISLRNVVWSRCSISVRSDTNRWAIIFTRQTDFDRWQHEWMMLLSWIKKGKFSTTAALCAILNKRDEDAHIYECCILSQNIQGLDIIPQWWVLQMLRSMKHGRSRDVTLGVQPRSD